MTPAPSPGAGHQPASSGEHLRGQDGASGASGRQPGLHHERAAQGRGGAAGHGVGRRTQLLLLTPPGRRDLLLSVAAL